MKHLLRARESIQWEAAFVQFDDAERSLDPERRGPRERSTLAGYASQTADAGWGPRRTPYPPRAPLALRAIHPQRQFARRIA